MRRSTRTIVIFAAPLLLMGSLYFVFVRGMNQPRPPVLTDTEPLVIERTSSSIPTDPTAPYWTNVRPTKVHLYPQTARVPYGTEERVLWVRGAYNDREVALLLEFDDDTENLGDPAVPDACAIMIAPSPGPATSQMMGHGSNANIWHWLADRNAAQYEEAADSVSVVRSLVATGPGTQSLLPSQTVEGRGAYIDGRWLVTFKRQLASRQEGELELHPRDELQITFAIWNGAAGESLSRKSIAILRAFRLGQS